MAALMQKWSSPSMTPEDVIWNTNCDILEEYHRQFGTCNCHVRTVCLLPSGREVRIGQWLDKQRKYKKATKGKPLNKERESRLQTLVNQGKLLWGILDMRDWDFMYDILVEYGRRHGTCNVPARWKENRGKGDEVNLGQWVRRQRKAKDRTMTLEHKEKMQRLADQGLFNWRMVRRRFRVACCTVLKIPW